MRDNLDHDGCKPVGRILCGCVHGVPCFAAIAKAGKATTDPLGTASAVISRNDDDDSISVCADV